MSNSELVKLSILQDQEELPETYKLMFMGLKKTVTLYSLDSLIALYLRKKDDNNNVPT